MDSRHSLIEQERGAIGHPYGTRLIIIDIHERCHLCRIGEGLSHLKWRYQSVEVAQLNHLAQAFVIVNSHGGLLAFLIGHVAWLQLHAQSSAHRHIAAELNG